MNNQAPFDMQKAFAAAQEILDAYPTLCLHGFGLHNQDRKPMTQQVAELANQRTRLVGHDSLRTIHVIIEWMGANLRPADEDAHGSYWLKGRAEAHIGYITNGQLILAAALLGYEFVIDGYDAIICCIVQPEN